GYRRALHGKPARKRRGWRRDRGAEASWTAERNMRMGESAMGHPLPRLTLLSIGVGGRLLKTAGETACERLACSLAVQALCSHPLPRAVAVRSRRHSRAPRTR